jgi:hypothetical protein
MMQSEFEETPGALVRVQGRRPRVIRVEVRSQGPAAGEQEMMSMEEWRKRALVIFLGRGAGIIRRAFRVKDLDQALQECRAADDEIEWAKVLKDGEVIAGFVRRGGTWLTSARSPERRT